MHEPDGYECPFCRIAGGHLPGRVILRTDAVLALVNIKWWPNNPGGCLVVPIEHFENVYELPPRLGTPIQAAVQRLALAMKDAFRCDGVSTRQHNEPAGNQDVWHYHVHVFPRWAGDDLYRLRGVQVPLVDVERVAAVLRAHVQDRPKAAAAVFRDDAGRILVVEPTYRDTWGLPGGGVEEGESPRQACAREVTEELGLDRPPGPLLCVDERTNERGIGSFRFLYDGGVLGPSEVAAITLPADELRSYRFVTVDEAASLLDPPLGRRLVSWAAHARSDGQPLFLVDGRLPAAPGGEVAAPR